MNILQIETPKQDQKPTVYFYDYGNDRVIGEPVRLFALVEFEPGRTGVIPLVFDTQGDSENPQDRITYLGMGGPEDGGRVTWGEEIKNVKEHLRKIGVLSSD